MAPNKSQRKILSYMSIALLIAYLSKITWTWTAFFDSILLFFFFLGEWNKLAGGRMRVSSRTPDSHLVRQCLNLWKKIVIDYWINKCGARILIPILREMCALSLRHTCTLACLVFFLIFLRFCQYFSGHRIISLFALYSVRVENKIHTNNGLYTPTKRSH